jgi:hypothetical protein
MKNIVKFDNITDCFKRSCKMILFKEQFSIYMKKIFSNSYNVEFLK